MTQTTITVKALAPHGGQPVLRAGADLPTATAAMILLHGRGASAEDILELSREFREPGVAYLAPQASGYTWYPNSFLMPLASNEPGISSGMSVIAALLTELQESGIPAERVMLLGFSQGACLALEYAARHARRYGAVAGLSGGLIGPEGTPRDYAGSFASTPVFLGCSDRDPHIPRARVEESAKLLEALGAEVTMKLYTGMGHTVNADEIRHVRALLKRVLEGDVNG